MRMRFFFYLAVLTGSIVHAQLSSTAYRVLGQVDLRQNGVNMVQGVELNQPNGAALDVRGGVTRIYISDTLNARILAWPDVNSYQIGDPPALILGQPGPQYSIPMGIGAKGLNSPLGLAVDPTNGNLYVADFGNSRVLRFPSPFDNPSRVEPDAVYGQPNFTTLSAPAASASTLKQPRAVAVDSVGNLWVGDTGNNRVLRFNAAALNNFVPTSADMVIGQKDFVSSSANAGGPVASAAVVSRYSDGTRFRSAEQSVRIGFSQCPRLKIFGSRWALLERRLSLLQFGDNRISPAMACCRSPRQPR